MWSTIPLDYDVRIRSVRHEFGVSQARFAELVGAARKAVVYQWESRKRTPSPVFWRRIEKLVAPGPNESASAPHKATRGPSQRRRSGAYDVRSPLRHPRAF